LPLELPVRSYTGVSYGAIIYTKGPLFFVALEREIGRETVYAAIAEYFRRHKYGIAVTEDVQRAFEDVSGRDLSALFDQWVRGREPRTDRTLPYIGTDQNAARAIYYPPR
jgi:aminopeptidase N